MEQQAISKYGKVVSARLKKETIKQLDEIREYYCKLYNFELSQSDIINMLILKEAKEKKIVK